MTPTGVKLEGESQYQWREKTNKREVKKNIGGKNSDKTQGTGGASISCFTVNSWLCVQGESLDVGMMNTIKWNNLTTFSCLPLIMA